MSKPTNHLQQIFLFEIWPMLREKEQFGIRTLPQQKVANPQFSRRSQQNIRRRALAGQQPGFYVFFRNVTGCNCSISTIGSQRSTRGHNLTSTAIAQTNIQIQRSFTISGVVFQLFQLFFHVLRYLIMSINQNSVAYIKMRPC